MQIDHFFGGSALAPVDGEGRVRLPRFVRETIGRRSDDRTLVVGPHETDPCLTGYDRPYRRVIFADAERLRLRKDLAASESPRPARRAFGLTEEAAFAEDGVVTMPAMARHFGRIEAHALFVGTGGAFEIWNPHLAAESDDPDLSALARWLLAEQHSDILSEED